MILPHAARGFAPGKPPHLEIRARPTQETSFGIVTAARQPPFKKMGSPRREALSATWLDLAQIAEGTNMGSSPGSAPTCEEPDIVAMDEPQSGLVRLFVVAQGSRGRVAPFTRRRRHSNSTKEHRSFAQPAQEKGRRSDAALIVTALLTQEAEPQEKGPLYPHTKKGRINDADPASPESSFTTFSAWALVSTCGSVEKP